MSDEQAVSVWSAAPSDLSVMTESERRALLVQATAVKGVETETDKFQWMNKTLHAQQVLGHSYHIVDEETGEISRRFRTVYLCDEANLSFTSEAATQFGELLLTVMGRGPWEPGVPFRFKMVTTGKGYRTYSFQVVDEPAAASPA